MNITKNTLIADRYKIIKYVSEGSYSVVYKGFDKERNRYAAIKILREHGFTKEEADIAKRLFFREIEFLRELKHPAIPEYYDFIYDGERYYLVMEWVEGKSLLEILEEKGPLSEKKAVYYMDRLADVLNFLQERDFPVVFKDLKPANIMIEENGNLKIIDFGTARHFSPEKRRDTEDLGTPGYAPPEAYRGIQTDKSADVYSFGATFHHILTGRDPMSYGFKFPEVKEVNPTVSDEISTLIRECLRPRDERVPDARTLKKRVRSIRLGRGDLLGMFNRITLQLVAFSFVLTSLFNLSLVSSGAGFGSVAVFYIPVFFATYVLLSFAYVVLSLMNLNLPFMSFHELLGINWKKVIPYVLIAGIILTYSMHGINTYLQNLNEENIVQTPVVTELNESDEENAEDTIIFFEPPEYNELNYYNRVPGALPEYQQDEGAYTRRDYHIKYQHLYPAKEPGYHRFP